MIPVNIPVFSQGFGGGLEKPFDSAASQAHGGGAGASWFSQIVASPTPVRLKKRGFPVERRHATPAGLGLTGNDL
jgi:hypothetical protein